MGRRKYHYEDVKELVESNGYLLLSKEEDIINDKGTVYTKTKIKVWCKNKNHKPYEVELANFIRGKRCRQCNIDSQRLTYEYVKKYIENYGYKLLSDTYEDVHKNLIIYCFECKKPFKMQFANFQQGQRCPKCGIKKRSKSRMYTYDYVKNFVQNNGDELISKEYNGCNENLKIKCGICGNIFDTYFDKYKNANCRCILCSKIISKGEKKVIDILDELGIEYIFQYKFNDCKSKNALPFDFYLPQYNCCIEYDGIQHFEIIKHFGGFDKFVYIKVRDTIKNIYCKNNNIPLIRMPYWEFDNINEEYIKNNLTRINFND